MLLYVLFVETKSAQQPVAVATLDELTVQQSPYNLKEYQDLTLGQVKKTVDEELKEWGWFQITLPDNTRQRVKEDLDDVTPTFSSNIVKSVPKEQNHPSVPGITVTVGRIPGKIKDDEIF